MNTAESIHQNFSEALNSNDIDCLMSLYEEGASLILHDGRVLTGLESIRSHFLSLFALKPNMVIDSPQIISAVGLVVLVAKWKLTGVTSVGEPFEEKGCTYDVLRRQVDGSWRIVFDSPWSGVVDTSQ